VTRSAANDAPTNSVSAPPRPFREGHFIGETAFEKIPTAGLMHYRKLESEESYPTLTDDGLVLANRTPL
jgi:hypothetical protein